MPHCIRWRQRADTVEKLPFSRKWVKNLPIEGLSENSLRGSAQDHRWQCPKLSEAPLRSLLQFGRRNRFWQKNAVVRFSSFSTQSAQSGPLDFVVRALAAWKLLQQRRSLHNCAAEQPAIHTSTPDMARSRIKSRDEAGSNSVKFNKW